MNYDTKVTYKVGGVTGESIFYDSARVLDTKERNKTEKKMDKFYKILNQKKLGFTYQLA